MLLGPNSRIIDLSVPLQNDVPADPPGYELSIEYKTHRETGPMWARRYEGLDPKDLPNGEAFAIEYLRLSTHNGTHVDAPWHYASTTTAGEPMPRIDEMPLDWFIGPGVKLDFRHLPDGHEVQPEEVEAELARIGHTLRPRDIVFVNTSAGARFGQKEYVFSGCGMGREATLYLTERGVRVTGTDAWGWDPPYPAMAEVWKRGRDPARIWSGHRAGREIPYCHIEKLHRLEELPPVGFTVICLPVKIHAASAGWTRAVAILDGEATPAA